MLFKGDILVDLGGVSGTRPLMGPNSFIFVHIFAKKVPMLGVHAPPHGKCWIRHWDKVLINDEFHTCYIKACLNDCDAKSPKCDSMKSHH